MYRSRISATSRRNDLDDVSQSHFETVRRKKIVRPDIPNLPPNDGHCQDLNGKLSYIDLSADHCVVYLAHHRTQLSYTKWFSGYCVQWVHDKADQNIRL